MRVLNIILVVALAVVLVGALVAPIGPVPGFFIGGTPTPAPSSWPDTSEVHEILLKVPGSPPRVVTVWVIQHEGALHVVGDPGSGWVRKLGNGGDVQMRLGDATYELSATRLTEGWQPVLTAYVEKYRPDYPDIVGDFPPLEEAEGQFALYRLTAG